MTLEQIAFAAECVTLARLDFLSKAVLDPILVGLGVERKSEPELEADRQARAREGKKRNKGARQKERPQRTPEERDAAIYRAARHWGIPITEGKEPG